MVKEIIKSAGKHAGALGLAAAVGLFSTLLLWSFNGEKIMAQRQAEKKRLMLETLSDINRDRPPVEWLHDLPANLPATKVIRIWRVWLANDIVAVVAQANAQYGYGGDISLIIAFTQHGLHGLRIVRHRETPGIADFLNDETGGRKALDGVSGATISATAIQLASQEVGRWIKNKKLFEK